MRPFRYLAFSGPASAEFFRAGAVRCGACVHLGNHNKEHSSGWCMKLRRMKRTDLAVECEHFSKAPA